MPGLLPVHSPARHSDVLSLARSTLCPQAKWTFTLRFAQAAVLALPPPEFSTIPSQSKPFSHSTQIPFLLNIYLFMSKGILLQKINQRPGLHAFESRKHKGQTAESVTADFIPLS